MKVNRLFPHLALCGAIISCLNWAIAGEPIRDLKDLAALEAKIAAVSRKTMPATVALLAEKTGASGSGVIATEGGLILTAAHVVQGADELTVVFPDGKQVTGKVLGANFSKDIAMVQILGKGKWPYAPLGESKPLVAGDWVIALGHSAGYDAARTPPVRFGRVVSEGPGNFLTSDCTLIGGDSGGPLFDIDGKIVGINSSIGTSFTNNNHAGIDGIKEDWERIRAGEVWGKLSMNPFVNPEMPVLGIGMGERRGVKGVPITSVFPKSPSAAAGVRTGDVIQKFDGSEIRDAAKLLQVLAKRQPGEKVRLGLLRDEKMIEVNVTLSSHETLYKNTSTVRAMPMSEDDVPLIMPEERKAIELQAEEVNQAILPALAEAGKSTVRVWSGSRMLAYGTVISDGTQIITKWSEVARAKGNVRIDYAGKIFRNAEVVGVYEGEDLALLEIDGEPLTPVNWSDKVPKLGSILAAAQPEGKPAALGVVSVLERNLRDTDFAFLGVIGEQGYNRQGVKVKEVAEKSGAEAAGIKAGDVILKIGERSISGVMELKNALVGTAPGETIALLIEENGRAKTVKVLLGNRSATPQFFGGRLEQMERMGGAISEVRTDFTRVIQSDMRPKPQQIGGPVVDLGGNVIGITMARADRTRSFIMPTAAVTELLKKEPTEPAKAEVRVAAKQPQLARGRTAQPPGRIIPEERMRRHLAEMQQLMEHMNQEMESLEESAER